MITATLDDSLEQLEGAAGRLDSHTRAQLAYRLFDSVCVDSADALDQGDRDGVQAAAKRLLDLRTDRATDHDGAEVMLAAFEQYP